MTILITLCLHMGCIGVFSWWEFSGIFTLTRGDFWLPEWEFPVALFCVISYHISIYSSVHFICLHASYLVCFIMMPLAVFDVFIPLCTVTCYFVVSFSVADIVLMAGFRHMPDKPRIWGPLKMSERICTIIFRLINTTCQFFDNIKDIQPISKRSYSNNSQKFISEDLACSG